MNDRTFDPLTLAAINHVADVMTEVAGVDWEGCLHVLDAVDASTMDDEEVAVWGPLVAGAHELRRMKEAALLLSDRAFGGPAETVAQASDLLSPEALKAFEEVELRCPPADAPEVSVEAILDAPEGPTEGRFGRSIEAVVVPLAGDPGHPEDHEPCLHHVEDLLDTYRLAVGDLVADVQARFPCLDLDHLISFSVVVEGEGP